MKVQQLYDIYGGQDLHEYGTGKGPNKLGKTWMNQDVDGSYHTKTQGKTNIGDIDGEWWWWD